MSPSLTTSTLSRGPGILRGLLAIVAGYVTDVVLTVAAVLGSHAAAIERLGRDAEIQVILWGVALASLAAGYVTAAIAGRREIIHGVVLGIVLLLPAWTYSRARIPSGPVGWGTISSIVMIILPIVVPVFGAWLRMRRRLQREERILIGMNDLAEASTASETDEIEPDSGHDREPLLR